MKKILYAFLVSLCISSCNLEVDPRDQYSDAVAWQNEEYLDLYVKGLYAALRDNAEIYTDMFSDGYSDILKYSISNLNSSTNQNKILQQENFITPSNGALSTWGNYERIKRLNEFLYDVDSKTAHLDPEFVKVRKAEVRFLRAFLYYKMIRNHGGVIARLHNSGVDGGLDNEKDVSKARLSEADSWNFVISELDAIAPELAAKIQWDSKNMGRITQGAVYALLTRCALYAKQYDKVIAAGNALEALKVYELSADYNSVFKNITNKELILTVAFEAPSYVHFHDRKFRPTGDMADRGGWACPTEELVGKYQIKEGDTYVDFNWNNPAHKADPYANREPRFYASVLYNGARWNNRTIETFVGGKDGYVDFDFSSNKPACVTGYFMKKFLQEGNANFDQSGSDAYWVELRYAEVLLNMSEAYAQSGNMPKAYEYMNKVRTRGGALSPRNSGTNLDVYLTYLMDERMLELAFEGHRYWDLRRWRKAEEVIDGQRAHGIKIVRNGTTLTYMKVVCDDSNRHFPEKYYYIPVPSSEINNNSACEQTIPW